MTTTRILIADDHGVLRAGLHALLDSEPGFEVVGEAKTGEEALQLAQHTLPDVVLLDIAMPGKDGLEVTAALRTACPASRVLILTASEEKDMLAEALRLGAAGYVVKRAVESELIGAIVAVMRGEIYVDPVVTRYLVERALPDTTQGLRAAGEELTPRELEVLALLATGMTNAQVAEKLSMSRRTAETHRANIMAKLHAHTRAELVSYAAEHGLLSDTPFPRSRRQ